MPPSFVPDWVKAARNRDGNGCIGVGDFDMLETVQVASAASRVAFRAETAIGQLSMSRSTLREHEPGALSNFLLRVTQHSRHLSALMVTLGRVDTATACKGLEDNMPNMKAKTKKSKAGPAAELTDADVFVGPTDKGMLFAETKPCGSEGQGYESMGYNKRCFDIEGAERVLPVHPLRTDVGLPFEAPLFGITTPVVDTAPAPNPIHSEAVVPGPQISPAVENTDPKLLQAACHLALQGVVWEERLGRLKAEYEARPWDEWTRIFNDTFPSPDCPKDTGDRRVLQAAMVADDDNITTHNLSELISTVEFLCKELDRMYPLHTHKNVVADYVGVTGYKRQHVHGDMRHVPLGSRTVSMF